MKRLFLLALTLIFCIFFFSSCADSSSDSDSGPDHTYNYVLYSNAGNLPVGRRVVYIIAECSDSRCDTLRTPVHLLEATATVNGQVSISHTHHYTGWYWTSVYIDVDSTNTLTQGDLIFGTNSGTPYGRFMEFSSEDTVNTTNYTWEDVADSFFGGYSTYDGTNQSTWSVEVETLHLANEQDRSFIF